MEFADIESEGQRRMKVKRFKVEISYSIDSYAKKFKRKDICEAYLCWKIRGRGKHAETEMLVGRARTFVAAKKKVIELFRRIPPSETLEIEK